MSAALQDELLFVPLSNFQHSVTLITGVNALGSLFRIFSESVCLNIKVRPFKMVHTHLRSPRSK